MVLGDTLDSRAETLALMVLTTFQWVISSTVKVRVVIVLISGLQGGLGKMIGIMAVRRQRKCPQDMNFYC